MTTTTAFWMRLRCSPPILTSSPSTRFTQTELAFMTVLCLTRRAKRPWAVQVCLILESLANRSQQVTSWPRLETPESPEPSR